MGGDDESIYFCAAVGCRVAGVPDDRGANPIRRADHWRCPAAELRHAVLVLVAVDDGRPAAGRGLRNEMRNPPRSSAAWRASPLHAMRSALTTRSARVRQAHDRPPAFRIDR